LLSLSLSPAFAPWGIPEAAPDDEPAGVDVVAGAGVEAGVEVAAGGVDEDPVVVDEPELPQPATATARDTRTSAQLAYRRADREVLLLMVCLSSSVVLVLARPGWSPSNSRLWSSDRRDAERRRSFPGHLPSVVCRLSLAPGPPATVRLGHARLRPPSDPAACLPYPSGCPALSRSPRPRPRATPGRTVLRSGRFSRRRF
jgi:hypothetical protein